MIARADPEDVKPLALRHPDGVEVLAPERLRQDILCLLRQGLELYSPG